MDSYIDPDTLDVQWRELSALVTEYPQECGVFNDVNLAGIEEPDVPDAPFVEFPRLADMDEDELAVVVAVAERYVDLHQSEYADNDPADPAEQADEGNVMPSGLYALVARVRAEATSVVRLEARSGAVVSIRPNRHGFAVVSATSAEPSNEAFGFHDVNLASIEACIERAVGFVAEQGETTIDHWDRDGSSWLHRETADQPLDSTNVASQLRSALA